MSRGRLVGEGAVLLTAYAAAMAVCLGLRLDPDPVLVAAVLLLGHAVLRLLVGVLAQPGDTWAIGRGDLEPDPGRDLALADVLRVIEDHRTARAPSPGLQTRLAAAADDVLLRHHRITRSDPAAAHLLGAELTGALSGPPRRLSLDEVDAFLHRIEAL